MAQKKAVGRPVVAGRDPSPVEAAKHDLDAVSGFVAALVIFDGLIPGFSARDAGPNPLLLQGIAETVGIIATINEQPLGFGKLIEQGSGTNMIANLACGHEEAERATICIRHGMKLGVHAAFLTVDQASRTPFYRQARCRAERVGYAARRVR